MKIDFGGVTRTLDLAHVTLRHAVAIQEFTGLTVFGWQERLDGTGDMTGADWKEDRAGTLARMPMFADAGWIMCVAAAHWLMLAQAGEDPPPLDDTYDCDVLGFYLAMLSARVAAVRAVRQRPGPDPTVPPGRPGQSSRRTANPQAPGPEPAAPLTGS